MDEVSLPSEVEDEERLHRALDPRANSFRPDGSVHYMAFYSKDVPHLISVDRARYRALEVSLMAWPAGCGVGRLIAGEVRRIACRPPPDVVGEPEGGNDAHAHIVVAETFSRSAVKTKICSMLRDICELIVPRPPPERSE